MYIPMDSEDFFTDEREAMVERQLRRRDITDERVLEAIGCVPRHLFVLPEQRKLAYMDGPLPILLGQTISQPYIVGFMTQALHLAGSEKVLEVGTGSGYQAAVLSCLARQVYTIERHAELAQGAASLLSRLGYANVSVHTGDGSIGLPEFAPFDAILVTAAAPRTPRPLLDQLTPQGRLVIPVGARGAQNIQIWQHGAAGWEYEAVLPVAFVPLLGQEGWKEPDEFFTFG